MCDAAHMWTALEAVREVLLGPLGMKTLDPGCVDWSLMCHYFTASVCVSVSMIFD